MPIAGPPTAATTGFFMFGSASNSARAGELPGSRGAFRKSATSLPAVKHSAVPASSTARTCLSASAAASAAPSCAYICTVIAFFLSRRSKRMRATPPAVSLLIKAIILELLPQGELGKLAGRGAQQLVIRHFLTGLLHRHHDRALVPFRVAYADHRRLRDRGMRDRDVLEVDRADPFAARLDHVLRAVGALDIAVRIDSAHVAGGKPGRSVFIFLQGIAAPTLEIALDHP